MPKQNHIFTKIRSGSQAERLAEALSRRNSVNSGKRISTVAALRDAGMGLRITCSSCGSTHTLSGNDMVKKLGASTELSSVRGACEDCGATAVSRVPVPA